MSPHTQRDIPRENIERWRTRGARAVGGPYGQQRTYLGHIPVAQISTVVDSVLLDSRAKTTKQFPIQSYPLLITDTFDNLFGGGDFTTQWVGKFDAPINNVRNICIPITAAEQLYTQDTSVTSAQIQGIVRMVLLKVNLNSGTFKLEDLTYALAHHPDRVDATISSLFSDTDNFVRLDNIQGSFPKEGFSLYPTSAAAGGDNVKTLNVFPPGDVDLGSVANIGLSFWFFRDGQATPFGTVDYRVAGDLGPFTGVLLYYSSPFDRKGGGTPEPSESGDRSQMEVRIPDPRPDTTPDLRAGRFPYAIGLPFTVLQENVTL